MFEISSKQDVARSAWRRLLFSVPVLYEAENGHGFWSLWDISDDGDSEGLWRIRSEPDNQHGNKTEKGYISDDVT